MTTLNERAYDLCNAMVGDADALGIVVSTLDCGTRVIDCGVKAPGSLEAGRRLAEVCLAGLGSVDVASVGPETSVLVRTQHPIAACMAAQYAGWEIKGEKFFAMGSGPMRAAACREELFRQIGLCERPALCVGVLETGKLPPESVCVDIADKCGVAAERLTLLVARTASCAGSLQIVARSVETALHKLHTLEFDLHRVVEGRGRAPLPPVASNDLAAIGVTNDAILYGGVVHLRVRGDDESLRALGPRVPSCASTDYGRPFGEIFAHYQGDFYRIDPLLFSPAVVSFENLDTNNTFTFGALALDIVAESFANK